jgi:outer membrane immunogenic protein
LQLLHAELEPCPQSLDRSSAARFGFSGGDMGFRRAVMLAGTSLLWGLSMAAPGQAHKPSDTFERPPPDDYVPYEPSGFFAFNWGGVYVGGSLGLSQSLAETTQVIREDAIIDPSLLSGRDLGFEQSETSLTGGIHAGWQKHWGRLVFGVEAGLSLQRFDNTTESPIIPKLFRSVELGGILSLTARLGYTDGRWLAYAKGGVISADIDVSYDDRFTGLSTSTSDREIGWTAGIGIDYALTQNLFLGVEYNFLHFRAEATAPSIPEFPVHIGPVEIDIQNVVVRLSYRFDPGFCCASPGGP